MLPTHEVSSQFEGRSYKNRISNFSNDWKRQYVRYIERRVFLQHCDLLHHGTVKSIEKACLNSGDNCN